MSDNCFLCLNKAKMNMCPANVCKMKCHRKCYEEYIKEQGTANIPCPVCRQVRKKRYNLRRRVKIKIVEKDDFITIVKSLLREIETIQGKENKKNVSIKLFDFIVINQWFLNEYIRFRLVVKSKLRELHMTENWRYPNDIHKKLFGEYIEN